ncbi:hypothetical protein FEM48_Zijuj12G0151600 [Ziziphus jujuba var. spinosa]|uniref:C3H1-type domain-containing protein n=1 Tax=Ziziphus jujuba var. spinosa TaxID=714518 RepID=A0A978UE22_ZIZJJ|nr:hypothetical protein FEM48_Zijuj12G0151600 [Ziziphus jujuba var. spinosa]
MAVLAATRVGVVERKQRRRATTICSYWLAGRCVRNPCRFFHPLSQSPSRPASIPNKRPLAISEAHPHKPTKRSPSTSSSTSSSVRPCEYWKSGNCFYGDCCRNLHSWFCADDFSISSKLAGHKNGITGIALPQGSDKLFTGDRDGSLRVWDYRSGKCTQKFDLGTEIGCLICKDSWIFVGTVDCVKAWNFETHLDFSLSGPVGQVYALAVGQDALFGGAQNGVISVWKLSDPENPGFPLTGSLEGHTCAVTSLVVGAKRLFSGSMDHTIRIWDTCSLQCVGTLNGHSAAVMSVICWNCCLISCSMDKSIKVWSTTKEDGTVEVIYTHDEECGVLSLFGIHDANDKPILLCSCEDNSVRLYELPSFLERGRLFGKQDIRAIQTSANDEGLFFTGDWTGMLTVWKWDRDPKIEDLHKRLKV